MLHTSRRQLCAGLARLTAHASSGHTLGADLGAVHASTRALSSYSNILVQTCEQHAVIELNRPQALNALSSPLEREVVDAVTQLAKDSSIRSIIITGKGKAFAAGADIKEMAQLTQAKAAQQGLFRGWTKLGSLKLQGVPLIAAVNGWALGGGCELVMMCDLAIASDKAVFGLPESSLGVIPGIGGTQRLPRLVGRHMALDVMLTGRRLDASEALAAGLVSRVVPQEQLIEEATAMAKKIASVPATAVRSLLAAMEAAENLPLLQGIESERSLFYALFDTQNQKEGMGAFLEKRRPQFKN